MVRRRRYRRPGLRSPRIRRQGVRRVCLAAVHEEDPALIGPERFGLSCAVEMAGLKDVTRVSELIDFVIGMSRNRNFGGILHLGQRNESA